MTQSGSGPISMKNDFTVRDGIATVELTQGRSMRVVEAALPFLAPHRWCVQRGNITWYAVTEVRRPDGHRERLYVHRLLCQLDYGDPREVDHFDGDGLNNLPANLRVTDSTGNNHNRHGKFRWHDGRATTSRYPGVYWEKGKAKWCARIEFAGRGIHLGLFAAEEDAAKTYVRAKAVRDAGCTRDEIRAARPRCQPKCKNPAATSRFLGVYWNKGRGKWCVQIAVAGRGVYLGLYAIEEDAVAAYLRAKAVRDAGGTHDDIRATRRIG